MEYNPARVWRYNTQRRKHYGDVGKLLSWSVVCVAPQGMQRHTPYIVGIVHIGHENVMGQIVDVTPDKLHEGMKVVGVMRRLFDVSGSAVIVYGVKYSARKSLSNVTIGT